MEKKINPIDVQVGSNIKTIRTKRGVSRQKLCESLSDPISQQAMALYESGDNRVAASTLVEIAKHLTCRVADLFQGVEEIIKDNTPPEVMLHNRGDQDMLKHYHALPTPELQAAVRNFTAALVLETANHFRRAKNAKLPK